MQTDICNNAVTSSHRNRQPLFGFPSYSIISDDSNDVFARRTMMPLYVIDLGSKSVVIVIGDECMLSQVQVRCLPYMVGSVSVIKRIVVAVGRFSSVIGDFTKPPTLIVVSCMPAVGSCDPSTTHQRFIGVERCHYTVSSLRSSFTTASKCCSKSR